MPLGSGARLPGPRFQIGYDVLERRSVTGPVTALKKIRNSTTACLAAVVAAANRLRADRAVPTT
jgi:hypothetical protein